MFIHIFEYIIYIYTQLSDQNRSDILILKSQNQIFFFLEVVDVIYISNDYR